MEQMAVDKNKEEFIKIWKDKINPEYENADKLLEWICGTDFFEAPASTRFHLAEKGGLCLHTLNVYKRLLKLVETEYHKDFVEPLGVTEGGLALVALCHDLCKAQTYVVDYRNKKEYNDKGSKSDEKGRFDWVVEEFFKVEPAFNFGHGSKSVFIMQNFLCGLPLNEAMAVRYHMGGLEYPEANFVEPNVTAVYNEYPLVVMLHTADLLASYLDEVVKKD